MASKNTHTRRDLLRKNIAQQAARLMAVDGIADYSLAKRKASKQVGISDTHQLHQPSNLEIEVALHNYRSLYQSEDHPAILRQLRLDALITMRLLRDFYPYLSGSVLNGCAGKYSDINLVLFSDDAKALLLFLLKQKLQFDDGEWLRRIGSRAERVPSYTLTSEAGTPIHLIVLPEKARFSGSRHTANLADIAAVETLLATTTAV